MMHENTNMSLELAWKLEEEIALERKRLLVMEAQKEQPTSALGWHYLLKDIEELKKSIEHRESLLSQTRNISQSKMLSTHDILAQEAKERAEEEKAQQHRIEHMHDHLHYGGSPWEFLEKHVQCRTIATSRIEEDYYGER